MKKSYLVIILVSVFIVLGGLLFYNYTKNSVQDDKETTENKDNIPTKENNTNISGNYIVTYTDKATEAAKANVKSTLTINSDATFLFQYNNCDMMQEISGKYEIKDNILTLLDTDKIKYGKNITFTIVSNDEIYLNDSIGCVLSAQEYQKGYGSFKKTND